MIVDAILNLLHSVLAPIIDALPKGTLPDGIFSGINAFSGYIDSVDQIVPIGAPFRFLVGVVLATVPAFITYKVAVFFFDKLRGS